MKSTLVKQLTVIWAVIGSSACASELQPSSYSKDVVEISNEISRYLQPVELDFASFLSANAHWRPPSDAQLEHWQQQLSRLKRQLNLKLEGKAACEQADLSAVEFNLSLLQQRQKLLTLKTNKSQYQGRFVTMENGVDWYKHWLRSWLLTDVSPGFLIRMAQEELILASSLRAKLVDQKKGSEITPLQGFFKSQHQEIENQFRERERIAMLKLSRMFATDFVPSKLSITPSNLPKSFPAPGIYDPQTKNFIYHLQSDVLPGEQLDWLFLHEGIPGHHFQSEAAPRLNVCPDTQVNIPSTVMAEGWAAYVEGMGEELGLYQHPDSQLYALDWRVLRALRVLTDVGVHYHGWSDEKANELWQGYLNDSIFRRELARIKRWPVQSITYVYGKYLIEQALKDIEQKAPASTLANRRRVVLGVTNKSPVVFKYIDQFLQ